MSDPQLFSHLERIRHAALAAVDPDAAVTRGLQLLPGNAVRMGEQAWQLATSEKVSLIAVGKAAVPMAKAAARQLGERLGRGIVVTRHGQGSCANLPLSVCVFESGHPVPDQAGLEAAQAVEQLLLSLGPDERLIVLVSGGASALLPLPPAGVRLDELQTLTGLLLKSGASINEMNAVRKHLDRLKGGQMARLAAPHPLAALILSDVVGDPLNVIASGPTVPDPSTFADAWTILEKYDLVDRASAAIQEHLRRGMSGEIAETPKPGDVVFETTSHLLVGSNRLAAEAAVRAAEESGYRALLLSTFVEGEAREMGKLAGALVKGIQRQSTPFAPPACLVWGGETTVTVRGGGKGGRNQELALAAALAMEGTSNAAVMALATDGIDGPTDAAGAVVDGETAARVRAQGLDPLQHLTDNNAYPLLQAAGALLVGGPTGTNVNDLLVILVRA